MVRNKLTKAEKETIILTSEADDFWSIYTFNPALISKLKKYAEHHPDLCHLKTEDAEYGSTTYEVRKSRLSLRLLEPCSDARRNAARISAKRNGLGSGKT